MARKGGKTTRRAPKAPRKRSSATESVTPGEKIKDDSLSGEMEKTSVTFGGFLNSRTSGSYKRGSIIRRLGRSSIAPIFSPISRATSGLTRAFRRVSGGISTSRPTTIPPAYRRRATSRCRRPTSGYPPISGTVDLMAAEKINAVFAINEVFLDVKSRETGLLPHRQAGSSSGAWATSGPRRT